ncbi:TetR/AcrR family transcriptional regulator [Lacticaseibacillus jixianensis]|uniref:TetR/AcrR family transcriptional regulator n=1 Tax=Lacticaseibacillus jixianensis TaxID=2486012 RepID=A0ABW4BCZ6_9LACO|nr:TetR/AcrR family transcriptional regulator [Lacticaseibacillus jixianensis]
MTNPINQTMEQQSCERLRHAMAELIRTEPFAEISITALTRRAGLSRMAFYRHYASKEAVLIAYMAERLEPLYDFMGRLPHKGPLFLSQAYFEYIDAHSDFLADLIHAQAELIPAACFREYVVRFYAEHVEQVPFTPHFKRYFNSYVGAGLYQMTLDWIRDGKKAPVTLIAQIAAKQAV